MVGVYYQVHTIHMIVMSFLGVGLLASVHFVSSEYEKIKDRESESSNGEVLGGGVRKVGGTLNQRMGTKKERSD